MQIIEIKHEDKEQVCELLAKANKALEEAMFKLKDITSESDTRMWRAEGDYRHYDYPKYDERRYRDDFRYRG